MAQKQTDLRTVSLKRILLYVAVLPLLVTCLINPARADTWNAAITDWFTGINWLDSSTPAAGDNVNIDNSGTPQIGSAGATARTLEIGRSGTGNLSINSGGTLRNVTGYIGNIAGGIGNAIVDGADSVWTNTSNLFIGNRGTGSLTISNGGLVTNRDGYIGNVSNGNNVVTIDGTDSTWINTRNLYIGNTGNGDLSISNGGNVRNTTGIIGSGATGTGSVYIEGTGSLWTNTSHLYIGNYGTGNLTINNGGMVSNRNGYIGNVGEGSVLVNGAGSIWTSTGHLYIGNYGTGNLIINNGGMVSNRNGYIGNVGNGNNMVTVDGAGSAWSNSGVLYIGNRGAGSLTISNGGKVTNTSSRIASIAGSTGTVNVTGAGSNWTNSSSLVVGNSGNGTLNIMNGGNVSNTSGTIGSGATGTGSATVNGAGSIWTNTSNLIIGNSGLGSLSISNGGIVTSRDGYIGNRGNGNNAVTVDGAGSTWSISRNFFIGNRGAGSLTISNGGKVTNTSSRIASIAGSTGTVNVTGAGSNWTNSSSLVVGNSGNGTLNIMNGGNVSNTSGTIGSGATGTGSATVNGAGSIWTNTSNLIIGNSGLGSLSISNGGIVTSRDGYIGNRGNGNNAVTVDGAGSTWSISRNLFIGNRGTGTLNISNGAVVNVNGIVRLANTGSATGTLNIGTGGSAGILNTTAVNGRSGTATLNFNHTDADYFFTNNASASGSPVNISGSISVNHMGSGTTVLTGTHTYTGPTTISNGTLLINGSISNSAVTVNGGGTLSGGVTVGTTNINNNATFAPGNSIGTTNIAGNVVFNTGSNYEVEVDAAGNSDLISATGSAILTGGIVNVRPEVGAYNASTDYTILTATGGLGSTTFSSVNSNLAFLEPTLSYDPNNVYLNLTRNSTAFSSIAGTSNQLAVSNVIADLSATNPAPVQNILNNLLLLTSQGANQSYDSLSGVQHTHGLYIGQRVSQQFLQVLLTRGSQSLSARFSSGNRQNSGSMSRTLLAYNGNDWASLATSNSLSNQSDIKTPKRGLWLRGFGSFGKIKRTSNASGVSHDTAGLAFGADHEWRDFVVGVAGSYARSDAGTLGGNIDINSYQVAGYGTWQKNTFYLNSVIGFAAHISDASRTVVVGPTVSRASADYETYNISTAIESGKDIRLPYATMLTPYVGIDYIHSKRSDFTETGAGAANLNVSDQDQDSLRTKIGFRLAHEINTKKISRITPYTAVAYVREHMDSTIQMNAGFAAAPASSFRVSSPGLDRDRLRVGLGVTGHFNEKTTLNVGYFGELADSHDIHSVSASVRVLW